MLSRKFFSNKIWEAARTFSECEAWLDLIQSARFEATDKVECIGGREITYGRGQYPASIRFLSKKWSWSERAVRTFLSKLIKEKMITTDNSQGMNVITLCKYNEYNSSGTANDTVNDTSINQEIRRLTELVTQLTTQLSTQYRHTGDTNSNKDNKDNNSSKKESPNGDEKEGTPSSCAHPDYVKFQEWIKHKAPFCSNPKNFPVQITEGEFFKLKAKYTGKEIADTIEQIENRKDLRKRYTNLYRTVLNWAKKEYGK